MKLLFINSASKVFHAPNGDFYINPHITNKGFRQYLSFCDEFTILLRDCGNVTQKEIGNLEKFDKSIGRLMPYPNIYTPTSIFNIYKQMKLRKMIKEQVKYADRVICGSQAGSVIGNYSAPIEVPLWA